MQEHYIDFNSRPSQVPIFDVPCNAGTPSEVASQCSLGVARDRPVLPLEAALLDLGQAVVQATRDGP